MKICSNECLIDILSVLKGNPAPNDANCQKYGPTIELYDLKFSQKQEPNKQAFYMVFKWPLCHFICYDWAKTLHQYSLKYDWHDENIIFFA